MKNAKRALIIDDEAAIRRLLRPNLESLGYVVAEAKNGAEGVREFDAQHPELVLLDLGLPDMPGAQVLKSLRRSGQASVLILTVQDSEEEKVALLDAGADDYLTKPFGVPELLARIRVLERHRQKGPAAPVVAWGDLELDTEARILRRGSVELKLTATEYDFLKLLALNLGKVVTQRQILREVWGPNSVEHTHYLRIYAAQIRKKIEVEPSQPRWLLTEPGVGYRLKA